MVQSNSAPAHPLRGNQSPRLADTSPERTPDRPTPCKEVLQVWDGYVQYPTQAKPDYQAFRRDGHLRPRRVLDARLHTIEAALDDLRQEILRK